MPLPTWEEDLDTSIPAHMRGAIRLYIDFGVSPGGFLTSVFANDFYGAMTRADHINQSALRKYADFLTLVPSGCWKSYEHVNSWCDRGGLRGHVAA